MKIAIKILTVAVVGGWLLAGVAPAQETNAWCPLPPQTKLESFETNTGTVIIKASAPIGTVAANAGALSVKCRQLTDSGSGQQEFGIVLGVATGNQPEASALVDYEELDSLLGALDYLNRLDWSVTSFPGFDAAYTSKGGFRVSAFGSRRTGNIDFAARALRSGQGPLVLSRDQLGQLRALLEQAKSKLDAIRGGK
jgi:hypothetical protein